MVVVDLDGVVVDVNDFDATGGPFLGEAVIGERLWNTPASVASAAWEAPWRLRFAQALGSDGSGSFDTEFMALSGELFAVRTAVTALRVEGEPVGFFVESSDIRHERDAADRLKEQERLRQLVFDQSYQLTAILDPDGTVRDVNAAVERLGWDRRQILGRNLVEISRAQPGGDVLGPLWAERLEAVRSAARPLRYREVRPLAVDGAMVAVDCTLTPVRGADGEVDVIIFEIQDRTASYRAEERLRASEERFRGMAELLPQMVWVSNGLGGVDYLSPRWVEFTGRPLDELLGRGYMDCIHPDDRRMSRSDRREGEASVAQFRLRRHDGVYRWMEARMQEHHGEDGAVIAVFGATTDITEQRAAQDDARAQQEYLRATLELTQYGTYTWYVAEDRFSDDSQLDTILGLPMEELVEGDAFARFFARVHPDDQPHTKASVLARSFSEGPTMTPSSGSSRLAPTDRRSAGARRWAVSSSTTTASRSA